MVCQYSAFLMQRVYDMLRACLRALELAEEHAFLILFWPVFSSSISLLTLPYSSWPSSRSGIQLHRAEEVFSRLGFSVSE